MVLPGPATAHGCSTDRSSSSGVSEDFRAAVKSRTWGKAAAFDISSLALNTCEEGQWTFKNSLHTGKIVQYQEIVSTFIGYLHIIYCTDCFIYYSINRLTYFEGY